MKGTMKKNIQEYIINDYEDEKYRSINFKKIFPAVEHENLFEFSKPNKLNRILIEHEKNIQKSNISYTLNSFSYDFNKKFQYFPDLNKYDPNKNNLNF
jgi:hypothetical protein